MSAQKQATFRIWRGECDGRRISRLHDRRFRGNGRARCGQSHSGNTGERPRLPLELQGRQMRLVLGGSQRHAEVDVHDAAERSAARKTGHSSADESVSARQGFDHGRLLEFSGEEKESRSSSRARRMRRMAHGACSRRTSIACRNSGNASNAFFARMSATSCAITGCTKNSSVRVF